MERISSRKGDADFYDIDCFVEALGGCPDPNYACLPCNCLNGDLDGDGDVDFFDLDPFTAAFGGTGLRTAYGWDAENRLVRVGPMAGYEIAGDVQVTFTSHAATGSSGGPVAALGTVHRLTHDAGDGSCGTMV